MPVFAPCGIIEETRANVSSFKKGDAVYSRPDVKRDGTYAEYISVKANELAYKPASIDHVTAAAFPLAGLTAWQCLFDHGQLKAGVGTFAVQFANAKAPMHGYRVKRKSCFPERIRSR